MNKIELEANAEGAKSRWTPLARVKVQGSGREFWKCRCQCGTVRVVRADIVKSGSSKSCGCWNQEMRSINGKKNRTHGFSGQKIYRSWSSMKARCQRPTDNKFQFYGARGIYVCPQWDKFENFLEDMGDTWFPGATIERKNVNGHYTPKNCIWIPANQQCRNQRQSVVVTFRGKQVRLAELCAKLGLRRDLVYGRLFKGWTLERAISQPAEIHRYVKN